MEVNTVITENKEYADTSNTYFNGVAKELKIPINKHLLGKVNNDNGPI